MFSWNDSENMTYTLAGSIFENNAAKNLKLKNDSRLKILKSSK